MGQSLSKHIEWRLECTGWCSQRHKFDVLTLALDILINLHGMEAMRVALEGVDQDSAELSLPEEEWSEIAEKTRVDYLEGFKAALAEMKRN